MPTARPAEIHNTKADQVPTQWHYGQQSSPNSTLVHNWAFASFAFAKSLGALGELEQAMAGARAQLLIRDPI